MPMTPAQSAPWMTLALNLRDAISTGRRDGEYHALLALRHAVEARVAEIVEEDSVTPEPVESHGESV